MLLVWERVRDYLPSMREAYKDPSYLKQLETIGNEFAEHFKKQDPAAYEAFLEAESSRSLWSGCLAIDIDGTLLDSKGRVPPANRDAIHRAARRRRPHRHCHRPQFSLRAAGARRAARRPHPARLQRRDCPLPLGRDAAAPADAAGGGAAGARGDHRMATRCGVRVRSAAGRPAGLRPHGLVAPQPGRLQAAQRRHHPGGRSARRRGQRRPGAGHLQRRRRRRCARSRRTWRRMPSRRTWK